MANSLSSLYNFVLAAQQIEALPILASRGGGVRNWNHNSPTPLPNTAIMAASLSSLYIFVLAARQIEALPISASEGG